MTPSSHIVATNSLIAKLNKVIIFPLMTLMIAVALLFFFWGVFQYILGGADDTAREKGRQHILYGIIGFVVMVSAYAILKIAGMTIGCDIATLGGCGTI